MADNRTALKPRDSSNLTSSSSPPQPSVVVSDGPEKEGMVNKCVCQGEVSGVHKER